MSRNLGEIAYKVSYLIMPSQQQLMPFVMIRKPFEMTINLGMIWAIPQVVQRFL